MNKINADITIIGAGVVGLAIARTLASTQKSILIIDKEKSAGYHSSTRNSAVLHAGFYYQPNSLKTLLCKKGSEMMQKFCKENEIKYKITGKYVLGTHPTQNDIVEGLYEQGKQNGVELYLLNSKEVQSDELKIHNSEQKILYSPNSGIADQKDIMKKLEQLVLKDKNTKLLKDCQFSKQISNTKGIHQLEVIHQGQKTIVETGFVVNSGGLHSDQICKKMGVTCPYTILPLRGAYMVLKKPFLMDKLIYPIPPIKGNNYLGIHTTITTDGKIKIGPSAIPIFTRDNYTFNPLNYKKQDIVEIGLNGAKALLSENKMVYINLLKKELRKLSPSFVLNEIQQICKTADQWKIEDFEWYWAGIRAQLVKEKTFEMEKDFVAIESINSIHLLNMASPAWTSSWAIAEYICQKLEKKI